MRGREQREGTTHAGSLRYRAGGVHLMPRQKRVEMDEPLNAKAIMLFQQEHGGGWNPLTSVKPMLVGKMWASNRVGPRSVIPLVRMVSA